MKHKWLILIIIFTTAIIAACEKDDNSPIDKYYPEPENLAPNEVALNDSIVIGNTQFTDEMAVKMLECKENEAWYMYERDMVKLISEYYTYTYDDNGRRIFIKYKKTSSNKHTTTGISGELSIAGFYSNGKYVLYLPIEHITDKPWSSTGYKSSEKNYTLEDNYLKCGTLPGLSIAAEPTPLKLVSVEKDRIIFDIETYVPAEKRIQGCRHVAYKRQYKNLVNTIVNDSNF